MEYRAKEFATLCHAGQIRKYTNEPYINHPVAVAEIVRSVPHTEAMICAALLHDVVEDTHVTLDEIERIFGYEVAALVEMLTDVSKPGDGNRAVRKAIDRAHIAKASPDAKTIKLADVIDNARTVLARDPKFAKVYLEEREFLLEALQGGDQSLMMVARKLIS